MTEEPKPFTVALLIETLAAFPQDMVVNMRVDDVLAEVMAINAGAQGVILE